jgi:ethanolamine utilization microcompartment shell protein EutS
VYVRSTTPQRTSILLEHRAIQSAIVEMLQLGCTVGFEGTTVIVEGTSAIKPSLREIMAAATAMLHHGLTLDAAPTG